MRKKTDPKVSTTAPWFLHGGQLVGVRQDLLEVLRAMDGKSPREIRREQQEEEVTAEASSGYKVVVPLDLSGIESVGGVAIVQAIGIVTQYAGICDWMFGGFSLERFMAELELAVVDDSVSSIVVVMNSAGGEAPGIADGADRIRVLSAIKPIVFCVTGDGCSAAYWLASAGSTIVASQTAVLGSIGIVVTFIDVSEADKQAGVRKIEFVSSVAPNKRADPNTDAGKTAMQALVDEYGEIFVSAIAGFRGVTTDKVKKDFGQGGVLIGASAVSAGLADKVGTLDDAIQMALELAGAAGDSSTGIPPVTTRAMGEKDRIVAGKTADQIKAENPDAVAEIATASAAAERARIAGILKYNTAAHRAYAAEMIDAAILDGKTTAGDLAAKILEAQDSRAGKTLADREKDGKDLLPNEPDPAVEASDQENDSRKPKTSTADVYARMNGQSPRGARA